MDREDRDKVRALGSSLELTTAPTVEPLTLEEVRDHLRLTTTDDDAYLDALIVGVRQAFEKTYDLALLTQTRKLRLDRGWPERIFLPHRPVQSVSSIAYLDPDGVSQTLASSVYQVVGARTTPDVDTPACYVTLAYNQSWPSIRIVPETITVTYVCGWLGRGSIPQPIRQAMLVAIAQLYEWRESTVDVGINDLPTIENLMADYRGYREYRYD